MALGLFDRREPPESRRPRRSALALATVTALVVAALVVGAAVASVALSHGSLRVGRTALARLELGALAGHVEHAVAITPAGTRVALTDDHGALTPRIPLAPGERVTLAVTVRRPGAISWFLGKTFTKHLTLVTPSVRVASQWLTLSRHGRLRVPFSGPVAAVAIDGGSRRSLRGQTLTLNPTSRSGAIIISVAARSWERLGPRTTITWFPRSRVPLLVATPALGATISPSRPLRLTFSKPLTRILGTSNPRLTPAVAGTWSRPNSHTLVFTPAGTGFPLAATVDVTLPTTVAAGNLEPLQTVSWTVAAGTTLRLEELLAQLGYLPLTWTPSSAPTAQTPEAEVAAAVDPPAGTFAWRYPNTPAELQSLWRAGKLSVVTKGAVMSFEADHGLATDGIAGPLVWHALLQAALTNERHSGPYSYVLVRVSTPESLTLYSGGHVAVQTVANTGIPGRSTRLGTFTVFEHVRSGTMSGTNPDGTHYHDHGIPWISYFNGGDAIHGFLRAQYGFPQSLGCVELPFSEAAKVWPYTPVGTLVTIAS